MQDSNTATKLPVQDQLTDPALRDDFADVFRIEIESLCHGFRQFKDELTPALVHRVIEELSGILRLAIERGYVFDLNALVHQFHEAVDGLIDELELTMSIVSVLPPPYSLDEESQFTFAQIIDQAEQSYGGVLECFERRWKKEQR